MPAADAIRTGALNLSAAIEVSAATSISAYRTALYHASSNAAVILAYI